MKTISKLAFAAALTLGATTHAQSSLDDQIDRARERGTIHGAVAVIVGGEIVHESWGGNLAEPDGEPIDRDTRYRIASLTKIFTQVGILQLADRGRLSLDDTVEHHRPALEADWAGDVTIRHLLAMTSGLPRELHGRPDIGVEFDAAGFAGPYLDQHGGLDLEREPGTAIAYSNLGYWMLGSVIEAITQKPFAEAINEMICEPLGMTATGPAADKLGDPPNAAGHQRQGDDFARVPDFDIAHRYSSGGLESTIGDMEKLALALLAGDLLSEESAELFFTNFNTDDDRRQLIAGMLPGFMNMFIIDADKRAAVIMLNNAVAENPNLFMRLMESVEKKAAKMGD